MLINKLNKLQRFFGFLPKFSIWISVLVTTIIVGLTIIFAPNIANIYLRPYVNLNWIFAILGVFVGLVLIVLAIFASKHQRISFKAFVIIGTTLLLIVQAFILVGYFFIASWDVGRITFPHDIDNYYYSIYPNNLFIHGLIVRGTNFLINSGFVEFLTNLASSHFPDSYKKILDIAGTRTEYIPYAINYVFLVFINICFITSSVVMISNIAKKTLGKSVAKIVFLFASVFTGLMPWILVPYSDTFGLFFTVLILFSWIYINNKPVKASLIVFATIIGYNIKPTVIFAFVALVFVEFCLLIKNYCSKTGFSELKSKYFNRAGKLKSVSTSIVCIIITGILCLAFVGKIKNIDTIHVDKNKEYTSTHFLMLGLDPVGRGFYTLENINISDSAKNVEEREEKNLEKVNTSIQELGSAGLIKLLLEKVTITYSDGTFMWRMDNGPNFMQFQIHTNPIVSSYYDNYGPFAQVLWYTILVGIILVIFCKNLRNNKYLAMMLTSILMLTLFLTIFECGARYLILYTPYFMLTATFGWTEIGRKIKNRTC